jgi:hypothetical protein
VCVMMCDTWRGPQETSRRRVANLTHLGGRGSVGFERGQLRVLELNFVLEHRYLNTARGLYGLSRSASERVASHTPWGRCPERATPRWNKWKGQQMERRPIKALAANRTFTLVYRLPRGRVSRVAYSDAKVANRNVGLSGGRSPTRPFRDARRFPSTRW